METEDIRRMGAQMSRGNPETRLQIVVCQYLDHVLPDEATYWASLNERKVNPVTGKLFNAMGRKAGVADILICHKRKTRVLNSNLSHGQLIAIELKLETNPNFGTKRTNQSQAQKDWQRLIEACGGFYAVCRSIDDVEGSLTAFGVPLKARVA